MIVLLSPAKSLNLTRAATTPRATKPMFLLEAAELVEVLRGMSSTRLARLMGISDELARLNVERFQSWKVPFTVKNARKALLVFDGDVYKGIDVDTYDVDDFAFAQDHIRILSGLYGLLRPLDLVQAYRLEMGTPLRVGKVRDLYAYWGDRISDALFADLKDHTSKVVVNLASDEYFKAVRPERLDRVRVIQPVFKEKRDGKYKIMSFFAKKARGLMADEIVRNRIDDIEELKQFRRGGYRYNRTLSTGETWVFSRSSPVPTTA